MVVAETAQITPADRLRGIALLLAAVAQILAGYLPILLDWPVTISDRSAALRTPLVPAGYAFSIWGLLFAWLLALSAWQLLQPRFALLQLRRVGWWIAVLFTIAAVWELYVPWQTLDWVSAILLLAALGIALGVSFVLHRDQGLTTSERWLLAYPLYALAGWLTAAFFANLSSTLMAAGPVWLNPVRLPVALALLAILFVLGASVALRLGAYAYVLPLVWALAAVAVSNLTWAYMPPLAIAAGVSALLLLAAPLLSRRGSQAAL
ncbi:MAG: hypothetical protein RIC87_16535 [Kiloniellales bacterium]